MPFVGGVQACTGLWSHHVVHRDGEAEDGPRPGPWIPCVHGVAGIRANRGRRSAWCPPPSALLPGCSSLNTLGQWRLICLLASLSLVSQMVKNSPAMQERPKLNLWFGKIPWRSEWQPTPVFLPGKSQEQRSLGGCSPWGHS